MSAGSRSITVTRDKGAAGPAPGSASRRGPARKTMIALAGAAIIVALTDALPAHSWPTGAGLTGTVVGATSQSGSLRGAKPLRSSPCAHHHPRLLCPDLIMSAPSQLHFDRTTIRWRLLLRAASSVNNLGSGPMELSFHRKGSRISAYQAIYDVHGRRHLFPSAARLTFKHVSGDRYGLPSIEALNYWKLRHAAAFQLWSINRHDRAIRLVRTGPKVDYCLRDLVLTHPLPRSPGTAVYPACNQNPYIRNDVLGTSVGWSDQYPYEYPEQWINVTGLRGRFAYVQVADPDNLLIESNHKNDVSETYIALPSGRVLGHRVAVSAP